jgi:two-component system cell cycle sensor histidine kinase/response regulator CckA
MKGKVLVVDNHPMIQKYMTDLLEKEGYEVRSAVDGISALDVLGSYVPDILFVDLVMPNISGEKLCRIIRNVPRLKDVFICILSAIAAEQEVDCTQFGANACIAKGPLNKMSRYVFSVLEEAESGALYACGGKTLGLEEVYKRHITKELLSSKRHFEIILDNMSQGILELTPDGRIVYVNPLALSMIATPEENLLGMKFPDLFHEEYRKTVKELFINVEATPKGINEDVPVLLNNKEVTLSLLPVRDENCLSLIVIVDDVGERRRMKAQILQAQKMKAIATLAGGIAHEFNNALQGIAGNIDLLELNVKEKESIDKFVYPMKSSVDRMSSLTNQLLAYAQGGKYQPKLISLNAIIVDTLLSVKHTIGPNIQIEKDLARDSYNVKADLTQLQMALLAVIHNAEEAIEGSGKIRVQTKNEEIKEKIIKDQFDIEPGPYACVIVEDNGIGMDEETLLRIFEPFFTTKFQGRGFSMAAVYGIIRNHNGWIDIDSSPGGGTSIKIYLPAAGTEKEIKEEPASGILEGSETILIIEDEKSVMQVTSDLLKILGYHVLEAENGMKAVKIVKEHKGPIHLAILDLGLPDMKGVNLFQHIRGARPETKVILASGYAIDGPAQDLLDSGALGFLQKPYNLSALSGKLREVLKKQ